METTMPDFKNLVPLTIGQAINWLDSRDYGLRGSEMMILSEFHVTPTILHSGKLTDVKTNGEIAFLSDTEKPQTFNIKESGVLIIFRKDAAKYVITTASPDPKSLTIKVLFGLLQLTLLQAEKWLDSYDYRLRGSQALILLDALGAPILCSGELTDANIDGEVTLLSDEGELQAFNLKKKGVLIVFQGDKPMYAIFNQ